MVCICRNSIRSHAHSIPFHPIVIFLASICYLKIPSLVCVHNFSIKGSSQISTESIVSFNLVIKCRCIYIACATLHALYSPSFVRFTPALDLLHSTWNMRPLLLITARFITGATVCICSDVYLRRNAFYPFKCPLTVLTVGTLLLVVFFSVITSHFGFMRRGSHGIISSLPSPSTLFQNIK